MQHCDEEQRAMEATRQAVGSGALFLRKGENGRVRELEIRYGDLQRLPREFGSLQGLKTLSLDFCENLVELPREIGSLKKLRHLQIDSCSSLTKIVTDFSSLVELRTLSICDCGNLTYFSNIEQLPNLQKLTLRGPGRLTSLPKGIWSLSSLEELSLQNFENVVEFSPLTIGRLTNLKVLGIYDFDRLQRLPAEIGNLSRLESLRVCGCPRLVIAQQDMDHLSSSVTHMLNNGLIQQLFDVYTRWNISGRHLLKANNVPDGLWATVFAQILPKVKAARQNDCIEDTDDDDHNEYRDEDYRIANNVLFLFLREKASLIQPINPKKRKRCVLLK